MFSTKKKKREKKQKTKTCFNENHIFSSKKTKKIFNNLFENTFQKYQFFFLFFFITYMASACENDGKVYRRMFIGHIFF